MKSYNFSMERVLGWRETLEKNCMEKFALLQNELLHEKLILTNLSKDYETLKEKGLKYININELVQLQLYKQNIEDKILHQNVVILNLSNSLEEIRLELISAQKDRKIMEKLKERDFSNYQDDMRATEQKELDEMAVLRFKRIL